MTYVASLAGILLLVAVAGFTLPFLAILIVQRSEARTSGALLAGLALVGASAGIAGGMSRAPAVGDIVPAFLGLLGAFVVYLFSDDQSKGTVAAFGAAALSVSLILGFAAGSSFRALPEDHRAARVICAQAYSNADLLGNEKAFQRFRAAMGLQCYHAMRWRVTTADEQPPDARGPKDIEADKEDPFLPEGGSRP